jgi:hypothetical protein
MTDTNSRTKASIWPTSSQVEFALQEEPKPVTAKPDRNLSRARPRGWRRAPRKCKLEQDFRALPMSAGMAITGTRWQDFAASAFLPTPVSQPRGRTRDGDRKGNLQG